MMVVIIVVMVMMVIVVMVVIMVAVVVVMVVMVMAAGLMQGLIKFLVHCRHQLDRLGDMGGERSLAFIAHRLLPFGKIGDMAFVVLYPVLQHDPQLFDVIHLVLQFFAAGGPTCYFS